MNRTQWEADQIRGVAMALRHWFDVADTEERMREVGIRPGRQNKKSPPDKRLQPFALTALPPQIVRLKPDAPVTTLHLLQTVYDDGELHADPWRWWFAWIAIEMISRLGPDPSGRQVKDFIRKDESLTHVRQTAARWLASSDARIEQVNRDYRSILKRAVEELDEPSDEDGLIQRLGQPLFVFIEAMASEAGRISSGITEQLAERVERS
ncbi:hypothetical protein NUH88_01785 [Nisaea acidiphila]|uniref:Uncharacterized protein n=1 Tax=Nisaea acidiphila TaxID=1862145 RepID=A0A9J7ATD1_9PROT|nr:hypothetical protein [Nisaea acidiphila]UUX50430.1 hypothetical protein NUH88_01785 [Nisaea acidiphila]